MDTPIIISGTIDLDPKRLDAALEAASPLIAGALAQPGCLDYDWCLNPRHAGRLRVFELWQNEAALAAHFAGPWYRQMRETLGQFGLVAASTAKYRVDHSEPVYDDTGTPRADFFTVPGQVE